MSDTQIIHQLLSQLGIKLSVNWSRSCLGYEGVKLRIYRLDQEYWERLWEILQKRQEKRQRLQKQRMENDEEKGSSPRLNIQNNEGDPSDTSVSESDPWLSEKTLSDMQAWLEASNYDSVVVQVIRQMMPDYAFVQLNLLQ